MVERKVRKKRHRGTLSPAWKYALETGDYFAATNEERFPNIDRKESAEIFLYVGCFAGADTPYWNDLRSIWFDHRDEILGEWKAQKRTGEPWAAKVFDGVEDGN
jgi:hypothetical protein